MFLSFREISNTYSIRKTLNGKYGHKGYVGENRAAMKTSACGDIDGFKSDANLLNLQPFFVNG